MTETVSGARAHAIVLPSRAVTVGARYAGRARPSVAGRRRLRRALTLFFLVTALAGSADAEKVVTVGGGVLDVDSYEVEGEWVRLRLAGRGVVLMPLAEIDRVVDDTLVAGADGSQVLVEPFDLDFDAADPLPETPFAELIYQTARRHGVSVRLVTAMIAVESDFDSAAVSSKGARGLLQLMPATAERFGVSAERLFEPAENLEAGLRYLTFLRDRFANDLARVLAAYNAGEGQVERYDGVPPFRETRAYVRDVVSRLGLTRGASAR